MSKLKYAICEYGHIRRADIPAAALKQWQRFDELHALRSGDTVFNWSRLHTVQAKNYVGVLQVGDLQVEILPKIDQDSPSEGGPPTAVLAQARQNLLFMLSLSRRLPVHERDLASQQIRRLPLWEALVRVFAGKLLLELRRGQQHAYTYREESLTCVRGRVLVHKQATQHVSLRHKLLVGYDEFANDTRINRLLKAGTLRLLAMTAHVENQQLLREGLLEMGDVSIQSVTPSDFDNIQLDRNSQRFHELLEFCRLVIAGTASTPEAGSRPMFSLLFPMEVLFEEFIGSCLRKFGSVLGFSQENLHLQSRSKRRWLLRDGNSNGRFRLKPDALITDQQGLPRVILDTKWKRLLSDGADPKNGVQQGDMYQLYAYATRYQCRNNVLLFPKVAGATAKRYTIDDDPLTSLRVEFVDLSYDLRLGRERLLSELQRITALTSIASP